MFCKHCGKSISGTTCDACGGKTILRAHSNAMPRFTPVAAPVAGGASGASSEAAYRKGLSEGFENGHKSGLSEGTQAANVIWHKRLILIAAAALCLCIVVGAVLFNVGHGKGYDAGRSAGYTKGYTDGLIEGKGLGATSKPTTRPIATPNDLSTPTPAAAPTATPAPAAIPTPAPVIPFPEDVGILKHGSNNDNVTLLQEYLKELAYYDTVDGNFGRGTKKAVQSFQRDHGLDADGAAGPMTLEALLIAVEAKREADYNALVQEPQLPELPLPEDPALLTGMLKGEETGITPDQDSEDDAAATTAAPDANDTQDSSVPPETPAPSDADNAEPNGTPEGDPLPDESNPPQDDAPIQQDSEAII